MNVVPVMDIRGGSCVHAKAGARADYRPLESVLTSRASDPIELAAAYHNRIGADRIYLADLDAIIDDRPNWNLIKRLTQCSTEIWADIGVRGPARAVTALEAGVETIVLGLESLDGPGALRQIVRGSSLPRDRFLLSLDLFEGRPMLAKDSDWGGGAGLAAIVKVAAELGLKRFLLLDLACVGVGRGVAGLEWVRPIREIVNQPEVWLGGGVRGPGDLDVIGELPVAGVLVGSAIHNGSIGRDELAALARKARQSPR